MTPKEKAKELRDNYIFTSLDSNDDYETLKLKILIHAKRCALIAVDELIKLEQARLIVGSHNYYDYYVEVKNEIEKL